MTIAYQYNAVRRGRKDYYVMHMPTFEPEEDILNIHCYIN